MVLMPNGNTNGYEMLTCNTNESRFARQFSEHRLLSLTDFDDFLVRIFLEVRQATAHGIYLHRDVYGFFIRTEALSTRSSPMDFILADMDNIYRMDALPGEGEHDNIKQLQWALDTFMDKFVDPSIRPAYQARLVYYSSKEKS